MLASKSSFEDRNVVGLLEDRRKNFCDEVRTSGPSREEKINYAEVFLSKTAFNLLT